MAIPTSTLGQVYKQALEDNRLVIPGDIDRYRKLSIQSFLEKETDPIATVQGQQRLASQTKRELQGTVVFELGANPIAEIEHNLNVNPRRYTVTTGTSAQIINKSENKFMIRNKDLSNPVFVDFMVKELDIADAEPSTLSTPLTIFSQVAKFSTQNPAANQYLGFSVSCSSSGNRCIAGATSEDDNGAVYVYERDPQAMVWSNPLKLTAADPTLGQELGFSVSISSDGKTVVGGAPYHEFNGSSNGAAYVFETDGSSWSQTAKLVASDTQQGAVFGTFNITSNDGNTIIVSATGQNHNGVSGVGACYIFERDPLLGWAESAKLLGNVSTENGYFGTCAALTADGSVIVAGSPNVNSQAGEMRVFQKTGPQTWEERQILIADDEASYNRFGQACCITGDGSLISVGATGPSSEDASAYTISQIPGSVYIFKRMSTSPLSYSQVAKINHPDPTALGSFFGSTVALYRGGMYVGAYHETVDGKSDVGASYVYKSSNGGLTWSLCQRLTTPISRAGDKFGSSCPVATSVDAGVIVCGAFGDSDYAENSGAVYMFHGY